MTRVRKLGLLWKEENKEVKGRRNILTPREKNEETKSTAPIEILTFTTDFSQLFCKLYN